MVDLSRAAWRKSTRSSTNGCVEVGLVDDQIAVRDSKDREGPVLIFTAHEWEAFLGGAQDGEFELPAAAAAGRPRRQCPHCRASPLT